MPFSFRDAYLHADPPICDQAALLYTSSLKGLRARNLLHATLLYSIRKKVHKEAGKRLVVIATRYESNHLDALWIVSRNRLEAKRISVKAGSMYIDGAIYHSAPYLEQKKWMLVALGNNDAYEYHLQGSAFHKLAENFGANLCFFNYPGVGRSKGETTLRKLMRSYRAVLEFVTSDQGLKACHVIAYGHSLGGAIQALALAEDLTDCPMTILYSRTFSSMTKLALTVENIPANALPASFRKAARYKSAASFAVKIFGWKMNVCKAVLSIKFPQYILQTASVKRYCWLMDPDQIRFDSIFPKSATLAYHIFSLQGPRCIAIPEDHDEPLRNPGRLVRLINSS